MITPRFISSANQSQPGGNLAWCCSLPILPLISKTNDTFASIYIFSRRRAFLRTFRSISRLDQTLFRLPDTPTGGARGCDNWMVRSRQGRQLTGRCSQWPSKTVVHRLLSSIRDAAGWWIKTVLSIWQPGKQRVNPGSYFAIRFDVFDPQQKLVFTVMYNRNDLMSLMNFSGSTRSK